MGRPMNDLTGQKFGKLTVKKLHEKALGVVWWLCECECGKEKLAISSNLTKGNTRSCGCLYAKGPAGKLGNCRKLVQEMKEKCDAVAKYAEPVRTQDVASERWQKRRVMAAAYRRAQGDAGVGLAEATSTSRSSESWGRER